MSESTQHGPGLTPGIYEVSARFHHGTQMEDAVTRLTMAGFDRADLSLPQADAAQATPEGGAEAVTTDTDRRQARTLGTGLAAAAGALAGAGITIATGGAAAVGLAAAAAAGGAAAAASNAVGQGAEGLSEVRHEEAAAQGLLVLTARTKNEGDRDRAMAAMRAAGALDVTALHRAA